MIVHPADKKTDTWFLGGSGLNTTSQDYARFVAEPDSPQKMKPRNYPFSKNAKIAFCIIITLVIINAIWVFFQNFSGPIFAFTAYGVILFLFLLKKEFLAGIIAGLGGFFVHVYELFFLGMGRLTNIEVVFLFANLFLPIPLIVFSFKAYQKMKQKCRE
ncbi:MAG: hypothetical protein JW755_10200 [Candidatus Aminicenantes bacterium]|nr:hypothetical protein [Candidatus Aminicenantes bacterium]